LAFLTRCRLFLRESFQPQAWHLTLTRPEPWLAALAAAFLLLAFFFGGAGMDASLGGEDEGDDEGGDDEGDAA
jgi:hypothetical protein